MIDKERFNRIKEKHGRYASWAVWASEGVRPTDNVGDLSVFDSHKNDTLLDQLNPNFVTRRPEYFRPLEFPLGNFHDKRRVSKDFKIRHALRGTALWGGYMTDIIKDFEQVIAGETMAYLRANAAFEDENLNLLQTELSDLGSQKPTLIAFGGDAFKVLDRNLRGRYAILKIPHYSARSNKEVYRQQVGDSISDLLIG